MWKECRHVNRSDITPQPPLIKPQCYRALLHHVSLTCGKNADVPRSDVPAPANQILVVQIPTSSPQLNLMVQRPTAPGQFDMWKNGDIPWSDILSPSLNWTQCLQSPTTPGQFHMWKNADAYPGQMYTPQLFEPSATELYYTMSVWYVDRMQMYLGQMYHPNQT